jgi:hypothetical protein
LGWKYSYEGKEFVFCAVAWALAVFTVRIDCEGRVERAIAEVKLAVKACGWASEGNFGFGYSIA